MQIESHDIHIWTADLAVSEPELEKYFAMLSPDECVRANRYHFPVHRGRFIAARSMLRTLISLYTSVAPQEILFSYDDNDKPFLKIPDHTQLQFNLSHSENMAVYAFTLGHAIGVDVEKVQDDYNQKVAERFFSQQENDALMRLPSQDRLTGFYRVWARKEAIIKAIGKGLSIALPSFSVSVNDDFEMVMIDNNESWSLLPVSIHSAYQSAVATNQIVKKISYWKFIEQSPKLDKVYNL